MRLARLAIALAALATSPIAGAPAGAQAQAPPPQFGINLNSGGVPLYANLVRGCSWFTPADTPGAGANVPLDQFQCPTTDFAIQINLVEARSGPTGDTYPMRFAGQSGNMTASLGGGYIAAQAWDPATNITTATLVLPPDVDQRLVWINFRQTRRLPGDPPGTGLDCRTLTIMRPVAPGSTEHHDPAEKFNRQLKAACAPWKGGWIRDLDLRNVSNVRDMPTITPATRTRPFAPLQNPLGPTVGNSPSRGMSFEDCVELANFLGCGLWTCFEDTGTDELFQLYLGIVAFGSDETGTAYTAPGGSNPVPASGPVHPPLAGRFFWEEGNEDWNSQFRQYDRYDQRGNANFAALNANGEGQGLIPRICQIAADLLRHADMARATIPGGLNVRYFPVYSTHATDLSTVTQGLTWLQRRTALRGETVAQNIALAGGDTYEELAGDDQNPHTVVTPAAITALLGTVPYKKYGGAAAQPLLVGTFGLPASSYEGGLAISGTNLGKAASLDPRFGEMVRDRGFNLVDAGYRYITPFTLIAGEWSLLDSIHDLTHPKYLAHKAVADAYPMDGRPPIPRPAPPALGFADPSFEQVRLDPIPGQLKYSPIPGSAWTWAGSSGINGPDSGLLNPGQAVPAGDQVAFLRATGSASQAVAGFTPGATYAIGGRMAGWITGNTPTPFDVTVDGKVIGTFTPAPGGYTGGYFDAFAAPFTATKTTHTIAFRTTASGGNQAVLLDALTISPAVAPPPDAAAIGRLLRQLRRSSTPR